MLRKTTFAEDSDQSISEEEDLAPDWAGNCMPLGETAEDRKGGIRIQSQLELLRDSHEITLEVKASHSLKKGKTGFSSEDEVEVPFFHEKDDLSSSPGMAFKANLNEGIISDDEDEACTWSAVNKEAGELVRLMENARPSSLHSGTSYTKKPDRGSRGKAKRKLLFRFESHREDTSSAFGSNVEVNLSSRILPVLEELKGSDRSSQENMNDEMIEESTSCRAPAKVIAGCGYTERSMADLLDNCMEKDDAPREISRMMGDDRSLSPSSQRKLDYEEPPEALHRGSSDGNKSPFPMNVHKLEFIIPSSKQKTMSDKFLEAFGVAATDEEGPDIALQGIGVFGKLQHVMQSEKKNDMDFLKRLQTSVGSVEKTCCIDVEILSRCLEAKLIVCRCSLSQEKEYVCMAESSGIMNKNVRTMTVIFSSRVCDAVELEVGNLIRIFSPWKEVRTEEKDEVIILSRYFSQILF